MYSRMCADRDEVEAGVANLWRGVIRQALWDVEHGHHSLALDGLDFLRSTGLWLDTILPVSSAGDLSRRIARSISRRIARNGDPFP